MHYCNATVHLSGIVTPNLDVFPLCCYVYHHTFRCSSGTCANTQNVWLLHCALHCRTGPIGSSKPPTQALATNRKEEMLWKVHLCSLHAVFTLGRKLRVQLSNCMCTPYKLQSHKINNSCSGSHLYTRWMDVLGTMSWLVKHLYEVGILSSV